MLKQKEMDYHSDLNKKLNVAYIHRCTEAEGPYKRMAIWFQGCDKKCTGCCNKDLQGFEIKHFMTIKEVLNIIHESQKLYSIEGITLLGGEPLLQKNLMFLLKEVRNVDLGVILFTGRTISQVEKNVLQYVDLVVDGEFLIDQIDNERNMIGSANQSIIHITERYKKMEDWFISNREKRIEINLSDSIFITGDVI